MRKVRMVTVTLMVVVGTLLGIPSAQAAASGKGLKCINVNPRWQLCGSASTTQFTVGVGIRFNEIDPSGRILTSRSYENCDQLAADATLPTDIRAEAARQCRGG